MRTGVSRPGNERVRPFDRLSRADGRIAKLPFQHLTLFPGMLHCARRVNGRVG
jgi:hypothetical protein